MATPNDATRRRQSLAGKQAARRRNMRAREANRRDEKARQDREWKERHGST